MVFNNYFDSNFWKPEMSKQCADECGRYSGFDPWFTVSEWNTPQSFFGCKMLRVQKIIKRVQRQVCFPKQLLPRWLVPEKTLGK